MKKVTNKMKIYAIVMVTKAIGFIFNIHKHKHIFSMMTVILIMITWKLLIIKFLISLLNQMKTFITLWLQRVLRNTFLYYLH